METGIVVLQLLPRLSDAAQRRGCADASSHRHGATGDPRDQGRRHTAVARSGGAGRGARARHGQATPDQPGQRPAVQRDLVPAQPLRERPRVLDHPLRGAHPLHLLAVDAPQGDHGVVGRVWGLSPRSIQIPFTHFYGMPIYSASHVPTAIATTPSALPGSQLYESDTTIKPTVGTGPHPTSEPPSHL